jgi:hypothetical protein
MGGGRRCSTMSATRYGVLCCVVNQITHGHTVINVQFCAILSWRCYVVLCYAVLCCATFCCAVMCCDAVLCDAMLCYAVLCYATQVAMRMKDLGLQTQQGYVRMRNVHQVAAPDDTEDNM